MSNFTFLYRDRRKYFDRNFIKIQHFWRETKANILVKILHYSTETNKYFKGNFVTNKYFDGNFDKFLHFCTETEAYILRVSLSELYIFVWRAETHSSNILR